MRKAEHQEFEFKRELAKLREEPVPFRFGEWLEECMKRMKITHQPSTVHSYTKQLGKSILPHWRDMELPEITRMEVHSTLFEKLDPDLHPNTRRWILNMVRRIFQMAVEEGILLRNPTQGIQVKVPESEQKVLTNAEALILLREAKICNHRFYPIWALALMTGMRSGELFALKWIDCDFDAKTISVNKQWTNKGGFGPTKSQKNRIVPISNDLLMFLREQKLASGGKTEFVLPQHREWQNGEQAQVLRNFCTLIGITSIKFHDLRATFITNLLSRGVSLARVMSMVGHSQIKTTNVYLRKAGVEVQGATESLGYQLPQVTDAQVFKLKT
ncbi:MAG: site-specific integrase [Xanthomonadaceae bacterium]|nr:site-specific integrase [Xanthomonadaceae bacterium]